MRTHTDVTAIVYTVQLDQLPDDLRADHVRYEIPLRVVDTGAGEVYIEVMDNHVSGEWIHLAAARLFRRSEGATFSGWVVESRAGNSDPILTKRHALYQLWIETEQLLNAHLIYGRADRRLADAYTDT